MASTHDDTFAKYKLYSGLAVGGVVLAMMLDSCSGGSDDEKLAEAEQAAPVAQAAANIEDNTVEQNLAPVEKLAVVDKNAPAAPARSGEEVYKAACLACHAAGVLEAPKLEPGAWDGRIEKGLEGLTTSAINGLNAMPARGGNPDITDEELSNAVSYMLTESGYDMAADAAPAKQAVVQAVTAAVAATGAVVATQVAAAPEQAQAPVAPESPETPAAPQTPAQDHQVSSQKYITDDIIGKQVYHNTCFTCHDVGIAESPVIGDTAAWQQLMASGIDALYNNTLNGKGAMPAKGGHSSLSDEDVKAAVDYILESSGVSAAEAATQEETTEAAVAETAQETAPAEATATQEAETEPAAKEAPAEVAPAAVVQSGINGEKIYRGLCFSCHDAGIANSPKLGDKAIWAPRIEAGVEAMYANSINGKGIMPAKGGNPALSDDEIKAAVDWMIQQSQ
uniref:Cytochrome c class I n=1 Tax=uncultured Thiotrichaceae bacterium TaxID=298394 RepID=A0A6S6TKR1_9GAMM|nr:MAG: Cytochrome c class I [uncultured Thiotrichaceae bacterium]